MKPQCARAWQVEAARDGRLQGKDLENALRHQTMCPDCANEARQITSLGQQMAELPELARDPLTARRSRHRLMAAMNEAFLESGQPQTAGRRAFALAFSAAAVAASWFAVRQHRAAPEAAVEARSIVEVHAGLGARWSEHVGDPLDRVDLTDGAASFTVHPHPGRRVVIRLPDGELEDMGTVFEIRVGNERTLHIAVSEGRVAVRLRGRAEFSLTAGQAWEFEPIPPLASAVSDAQNGVLGVLAGTPPRAMAAKPRASLGSEPSRSPGVAPVNEQRALASREATAEMAPPTDAAPSAQSAKAEDEAYLHIVDLLRQDKPTEARSQAKAYLLRFPNGFRRVEVLNIATRSPNASDDSDAH